MVDNILLISWVICVYVYFNLVKKKEKGSQNVDAWGHRLHCPPKSKSACLIIQNKISFLKFQYILTGVLKLLNYKINSFR